MDPSQLEEKHLPIDTLFLDPNNPRFWSEQTRRDIPDRKVSDPEVQADARQRITNHGIPELADSILRNGFLPLDRIVVRPLVGVKDEYVVVEGNRRLAALTQLRKQIEQALIDEDGISEADLDRFTEATARVEVLVYTGEDGRDIAWLLQGIRHISGIRNWRPAQQGKLVADQIDKEGLGLREAGQRFGLSARAVGRLYRSFKALEQMRDDEEYSNEAKNEWFTLFEEAIGNSDVKQWLGWDDGEKRFTHVDALHDFYSLIIPDPDHANERRIHDPKQIKKLGTILRSDDALLSEIKDYEITIDAAYDRVITRGTQRHEWRRAFEKAESLLNDIPQGDIRANSSEVLKAVSDLLRVIETLRDMAEAVEDAS